MSPAGPTLHRHTLLVPAQWGPVFSELLESLEPITLQVDYEQPGDMWRLRMLTDPSVDTAGLEARLALLAASLGMAAPAAIHSEELEAVDPTDWLTMSARAFPPLNLGRFFVFGSHYEGPFPAAAFPLLVDAATAFGSGEHGTTAGCLTAMERLAKAQGFANILDLGTGTGLLAMAAARLWPEARILASDIDREAARVARLNTSLNRLAPRIACTRATGYAAPAIRGRAPFDLILANILTRPLCAMAGDLARHLAPGGRAVLSGFLDEDRNWIRVTHGLVGLTAVDHISVNGWSTMVLTKVAR